MTAMTQPMISSAQCCIIAFRTPRTSRLRLVQWTLHFILLSCRSVFRRKREELVEKRWPISGDVRRTFDSGLRGSLITGHLRAGEWGKAWPHPGPLSTPVVTPVRDAFHSNLNCGSATLQHSGTFIMDIQNAIKDMQNIYMINKMYSHIPLLSIKYNCNI